MRKIARQIQNPLHPKPLILKKPPMQDQIQEYILVGGPFDGKRYNVDRNQLSFDLHHDRFAHTYHKVDIEDPNGYTVSFFRHQTLSDVAAVIRCIKQYGN